MKKNNLICRQFWITTGILMGNKARNKKHFEKTRLKHIGCDVPPMAESFYNVHQPYAPGQFVNHLITPAYQGAGKLPMEFKDTLFPTVSNRHADDLCLVIARQIDSSRWSISRYYGEELGSEEQCKRMVLYNGPATQEEVVKLLKDWSTLAHVRCGNGQDISVEPNYYLVSNITIIPMLQ